MLLESAERLKKKVDEIAITAMGTRLDGVMVGASALESGRAVVQTSSESYRRLY